MPTAQPTKRLRRLPGHPKLHLYGGAALGFLGLVLVFLATQSEPAEGRRAALGVALAIGGQLVWWAGALELGLFGSKLVLAQKCLTCGAHNRPRARTCEGCGAKLSLLSRREPRG